MGNEKRRKLWVDQQLQGALAMRILLHWVAFMVVSFSLMFVFHFLSNPLEPASSHLQKVFVAHRYFLIVALIMLPAFVYDSVQLSNRFAGPIVRFRRLIQAVGTGQPVQKIKFRDGDFWHELSADLNGMLDRIQSGMPTPLAKPSGVAIGGPDASRRQADEQPTREPVEAAGR